MKKILALILALVMVLCLCACGSKEEAPAEAPAAEAPAAAPAAAPAEGEAAPVDGVEGEPSSGEPQSFELFDAAGYDKTFDGYKQYLVDAINSTEGPEDIKAMDIANIEAMTEDTYADTTISMYLEFGLVMTWPEFQG